MNTEKYFSKTSFVKSITDLDKRPKPKLPEHAFLGRSNVGKSSLLNSVFNRRNLVKVSSTPGKTQLINYFLVDDKFYCVDLPGYGYAKLPKALKLKWERMLEDYLLNNNHLKALYLLIDSRHSLQKSDQDMIAWLKNFNFPFIIILSKTDKLKSNDLNKQLRYFEKSLPTLSIYPFSIKNQDYIEKFRIKLIQSAV